MPVDFDAEVKKKALLDVAAQISVAARTAPKSRGRDDLLISILADEEMELVAKELESLSLERGVGWFKRDADSVRKSQALILIGVKGSKARELNCSGCGYSGCAEFGKVEKIARVDFSGPNCIFPLIDLGIALGSAVKLASELGVDNRIMYTVGLAAKKLGLIEADVVMGLPLSATGKNIYFDRPKV
ncbi:MAG: ferredoxin domain-containing protein [Nitrososphaeria archaeon]